MSQSWFTFKARQALDIDQHHNSTGHSPATSLLELSTHTPTSGQCGAMRGCTCQGKQESCKSELGRYNRRRTCREWQIRTGTQRMDHEHGTKVPMQQGWCMRHGLAPCTCRQPCVLCDTCSCLNRRLVPPTAFWRSGCCCRHVSAAHHHCTIGICRRCHCCYRCAGGCGVQLAVVGLLEVKHTLGLRGRAGVRTRAATWRANTQAARRLSTTMPLTWLHNH
jgi:hypothetical protein